jgi:CRISPR-associated protein Csx17
VIELTLTGCRPEPLGSYLKALGVLRIVGNQKDPEVRGRWRGDTFMLSSALDETDLVAFFRDEYRPTPLLAPWNSGSGFRVQGKLPEAKETLQMIKSSSEERLAAYRDAIVAGQDVVADGERRAWLDPSGKQFWDKKHKADVVELCRARFPDEALAWLDAAVVLAEEPEFGVPLLGGTGGNLGNFELSVGFMQRLIQVLCLRSGPREPTLTDSSGWLRAALFADSTMRGVMGPVGQFDPGAAGGVNSSPLGKAASVVNPWDFVLMLEGACLFASAPARRLGASSRGKASMPFMFGASPAGFASASSSESAKGELWAPVWQRPATAREISHLFGEGRAEWQGRQAGTGGEMVRAAATLGVDRGVETFVRHVFVDRLGQSPLAVPVGRVRVRDSGDVPLLSRLDPWVDRVRRGKNMPATVAMAIRRFDMAAFELAVQGGPAELQQVLLAAADLESGVSRAPAFRKGSPDLRPIQGLAASAWVPHLDDGSAEFRLAVALASQHDGGGACLRWLLGPVARSRNTPGLVWSEAPAPVVGLGHRPIHEVLALAHARRSVEVRTSSKDPEALPVPGEGEAGTGFQTAYRWRIAAPGIDVARFATGDIDEARLGEWLEALLLLDWAAGTVEVSGWFIPSQPFQDWGALAPTAWALLAPFFHGRPIPVSSDTTVHLRPEADWPGRLASGAVLPVVDAALRRLRIARLKPALADPGILQRTGPQGPWLAATLLCPITAQTAASLIRRIAPPSLE